MTNVNAICCDGCGQLATPEHVMRRLRRLEWATRYRPIHMNALFLGAAAPSADSEVLYAPDGEFAGEAESLLRATGVNIDGKSREAILAELQHRGYFLAHVLECPFEPTKNNAGTIQSLLQERWPLALSRIRRSLKPKIVIPISSALGPLLSRLQPSELDYAAIVDDGRPFALDGEDAEGAITRMRTVVTARAAVHS